MPLSTAALALAVKDASRIATRDSICHANFKLQLQQMLLREAHGDPEKKLSKAAFLLSVLKEYGLVDSQTLQTIDEQYELTRTRTQTQTQTQTQTRTLTLTLP